MSTIIHPSSITEYGPWLLDFRKLEELDKVFESQLEKLKKYRSYLIDNEVLKRKKEYSGLDYEIDDEGLRRKLETNYQFADCYRELIINYKSDKTVKAESFKEIAMNKDINSEFPIDFSYTLSVANVKARISLGRSEISRNEISVSVENNTTSEGKELLYEIEKWIKNTRPNILVKFWRRYARWFLYFAYMCINLYIIFIPDTNKTIVKNEAFEILKNGIQQDEVPKALEILLTLETNFKKAKIETKTSDNIIFMNLIYLSIALFISLILYFGPNSVIGINKGEKKLRIIDTYVKIVTYIIPVLFLLPFIINKLSNWI
ncbi:MAG: hypothetical protein GXX85_04230 [Ignavibacteria bacterium]|nr:hypothetical protein [Ignavibacteria bacterium]